MAVAQTGPVRRWRKKKNGRGRSSHDGYEHRAGELLVGGNQGERDIEQAGRGLNRDASAGERLGVVEGVHRGQAASGRGRY